MTENLDAQALDDSPFYDTAKGILIATPIGLLLWALIILAMSKLL